METTACRVNKSNLLRRDEGYTVSALGRVWSRDGGSDKTTFFGSSVPESRSRGTRAEEPVRLVSLEKGRRTRLRATEGEVRTGEEGFVLSFLPGPFLPHSFRPKT